MRPLLSGEIQIKWPEVEDQDDIGHPIFRSAEGNTYSLDLQSQRILVIRNRGCPIIINTDYGIPALESCYCLQMNRNGFLLLEKLPGCCDYRRTGCAQWHEDKTFFGDSETIAVNLV
jgi:hypothetical protein